MQLPSRTKDLTSQKNNNSNRKKITEENSELAEKEKAI